MEKFEELTIVRCLSFMKVNIPFVILDKAGKNLGFMSKVQPSGTTGKTQVLLGFYWAILRNMVIIKLCKL